jgi:hypothetical protein
MTDLSAGGEPSEFDRDMGKPDPCKWCGFAWSVHRCQDALCPGLDDAGELWRGSWDRSKGTTYEEEKRREK